MLQVLREFKVGRPQVYAGLMLLAFMAQCLWTADTRKVSDLEYRYIASGLTGAGEKTLNSSPFTGLVAAFPVRLHFRGKKDSHTAIERGACGSSAVAAAAAVHDFWGVAGSGIVVGGASFV